MNTVSYAIFNESEIAALALKRLIYNFSFLAKDYSLICRFKAHTPEVLLASLRTWYHMLDVLIVGHPFSLPATGTMMPVIRRDFPFIRMLFITPGRSQSMHNILYDAGAAGIISSSSSFEEMVSACHTLKKEGVLANQSFNEYHRQWLESKNSDVLVDAYTPSDLEIAAVKYINLGMSQKETAVKLETEETKIHHLFEKLRGKYGLKNNHELTSYFRKKQYISDSRE